MRIAMICGSAKPRGSTSQYLLDALLERLEGSHQVLTCRTEEALERLAAWGGRLDALVLAFPLHFDAIPSGLQRVLEALGDSPDWAAPGCRLYGAVNCGFYEPEQNAVALDMLELWRRRRGLEQGRFLSLGAGGASRAAPLGEGPAEELGRAVELLAADLAAGRGGETLWVRSGLSREAYRQAAEAGWRRAIAKRGLTPDDLYRRPGVE